MNPPLPPCPEPPLPPPLPPRPPAPVEEDADDELEPTTSALLVEVDVCCWSLLHATSTIGEANETTREARRSLECIEPIKVGSCARGNVVFVGGVSLSALVHERFSRLALACPA